MQLVIVSGLSGSGKSVALDTLEDFGAHCVDNMPPTLLLDYVELLMQPDSHYPKQAAIGMDARALPKDLDRLPSILEQIRELPCDITVMFLDSDEDTLIRRFNDTRRRHPLADRVLDTARGGPTGARVPRGDRQPSRSAPGHLPHQRP